MPDLVGLRDRALIAVMVYSFARVSAVAGMNVEDYYQNGKRSWLRLHEKGGKFHEVPAHHNAEAYLDEYLDALPGARERKTPLFCSARAKAGILTEKRMSRTDVLRMIERSAQLAGLPLRHVVTRLGPPVLRLIWRTLERLRRRRPSPVMNHRERRNFTTERLTRSPCTRLSE